MVYTNLYFYKKTKKKKKKKRRRRRKIHVSIQIGHLLGSQTNLSESVCNFNMADK